MVEIADKNIFDGSNAESSNQGQEPAGDRPVLKNDQEGTAAWLNRDKNGNAYLSVRLPLGLGSVNLFPPTDEMADALNQLADYVEEQ